MMENTNGACTKKQLNEYGHSLKRYRDLRGIMDTARQEGRMEEKISIARAMKKDGVPTAQIAKFTNLPPEEIEKIARTSL